MNPYFFGETFPGKYFCWNYCQKYI
jgi:hypothetical protein